MNILMVLDILLGLFFPILGIILFYMKKISKEHFLFFWIGFLIGLTWELTFHFLGSGFVEILVDWPFPGFFRRFIHTSWDATLFICGLLLVKLYSKIFLKKTDYCEEFSVIEILIMVLWGTGTSIVVEYLGNGKLWEYQPSSLNPVWLTIGEQDYTLLPQLVWLIAPVIYYFCILFINKNKTASK